MKLGRHLGSVLVMLATVFTIGAAQQSPLAVAADRPAAALLAATERRVEDGDVAGALEDYALLVRQFPTSPEAPEAWLRIARLRLPEPGQDPAPALAIVEELVSAYPQSPQAAEALLLKAEIHIENARSSADLEQARSMLEKVWLLFPSRAHPGLEARSAARVADGELALWLQLGNEAATSFVAVIESEPLSRWTARAHSGLATALMRQGDWSAAVESFQAAADSPKAEPAAAALAKRRLTLAHRRFLRPGGAWTQARRYRFPDTEVRRPATVAVDDAGTLLLYDDRTSKLLRIDPHGKVTDRWPTRAAERAAWTADGEPLVAVRDALTLPARPSRHEFITPGKNKNLEGLIAAQVGRFGEWYLLTARSTGVLRFDASGDQGQEILPPDGDPVDLAIDALGRIYVLERKGRRVVRFAPGRDSGETLVTGSWRQALALSVDMFGFVYVLDGDTKRVEVYDPNGRPVEKLGPTLPGSIEIERPHDLAVSGDGRLYLVDGKNGLVEVD